MKRKLNEVGEPVAVDVQDANAAPSAFAALGLDSRLLQAVAKQNFTYPTAGPGQGYTFGCSRQRYTRPLSNRLRKTAAYVLPILQSILQRKAVRGIFYPHQVHC